ncbi:MAG TPA: ATP-binding protein, partial [Gallionellaceae bacterium]
DLRFDIDEDNLNLRQTQLRARLHMYPMMVSGQLLIELLFVALFWQHADRSLLLGWLGTMYTLHAIEMLGCSRHGAAMATVEQCRLWNGRFLRYASAIGLAWGSVALLFFPADMAYQTLLICVVLGLAAGAVTMNAVHPPTLYVYVLLVTLPLLLRLGMSGDFVHWVLFGMLLLFLLMVLNAGRELSQTYWTSLQRRHENDALILQLTEQTARAEAASRDKSRFLAAASHDLRQPLQALVLFSEALQETAQEKATLQLAGQIGKSVNALVDMFDELLNVSRLDAGVVEVRWRHFHLHDILDRLYLDFAQQAHGKGLMFEVSNCTHAVYSDPHLLERILRNLISNAVRYTHSGEVRVRCREEEGRILLEVADTGIGISAENLPHIFDEYFQASNPQRDRRLGLGLGLSIVRRLAALLGYRIEVSSEQGKGSVFSLRVQSGDAGRVSTSFAPAPALHDLDGVAVALVEDDEDIRHTVAALMRQWGCRVSDGAMPDEVMPALNAGGRRPDILVCDYRLPLGVTALDVIRQMREQWGSSLPALVLTGDTEAQTLLDIQGSGARLLHKPITPARLRSVMYAALHGEA